MAVAATWAAAILQAIIDGEVVLEHGRLTKFDEEEIYAHAKAVAEKF